jgi:hypothetical protein
MTKITVKRAQVRDLYDALNLVRNLSVPSLFRYAIKINTDSIQSIYDAIREAWPEPDVSEYRQDVAALEATARKENKPPASKVVDKLEKKHADVLAAHQKWAADIKPYLEEEVEIQVFKTELPEIDDTKFVSPEMRDARNQAIVDALVPIIKVS